MARNIGADGRTVYRAVIEKTYADGRGYTAHEGPYTEPGPARARVTFWANRMARLDGSATGRIEQAHTVWAPVGEDADPLAIVTAQAYRTAAGQITARQERMEQEERDEFGALDHETELQGGAVRDMAEHLRKLAAAIYTDPTEEPAPADTGRPIPLDIAKCPDSCPCRTTVVEPIQ
jgi:hypothetical protein